MVPIPQHNLKVALVHPQIAPNTGNIARLCVVAGCALHLVRPMGFVLSDRMLKRAGLDYWPRLQLTVHDDLNAFLQALGDARAWLYRSKSDHSAFDATVGPDDWLIFGSETNGLREKQFSDANARSIALPMASNERCLNLSTAVGAGVYVALQQIARR